MSTPRFEIFEAYAQEHNSRILKASDDARLLRSVSKKNQASQPSPSISHSRLASILAFLLCVLKQQPA